MQSRRKGSRAEYCRREFQLRNVSVLLVSRKSDYRSLNLSYLANELRKTGKLGRVTHIHSLRDYPVSEQARLFATHHFNVQSHGAGETNIVFSNAPNQKDGPPSITVEVSGPYADCEECKKGGPWFSYRYYMPWMLTYSIGSLSPMMNCSVFCSEINGKDSPHQISRVFRREFPPSNVRSEHVISLISDKLESHIIPHCSGKEIKGPDKSGEPFRAVTLPIDEDSESFQSLSRCYREFTKKDFPRTPAER